MAIDQAVIREITQLHSFFESWLAGQLPNTDDAFDRADRVIAPDFTIVEPSGTEVNRTQLVTGLRAAWGQRPGVRIWATSVQIMAQGGPLVFARYEERQQLNGRETRRISTAIFRETPETPNGLSWLRVHETWVANS
jgi:hypothetical protein